MITFLDSINWPTLIILALVLIATPNVPKALKHYEEKDDPSNTDLQVKNALSWYVKHSNVIVPVVAVIALLFNVGAIFDLIGDVIGLIIIALVVVIVLPLMVKGAFKPDRKRTTDEASEDQEHVEPGRTKDGQFYGDPAVYIGVAPVDYAVNAWINPKTGETVFTRDPDDPGPVGWLKSELHRSGDVYPVDSEVTPHWDVNNPKFVGRYGEPKDT